MPKSVDDWINESEDWQKVYLKHLRTIILAAVPDAEEALKWGQPCYSRNSLFCYLQRAKAHVTLGFQKGAQMSDPGGLLEGEGKLMRHVRFGRNAVIDEPACISLIEAAVALD